MPRRYTIQGGETTFYSVAVERWNWRFAFGLSTFDAPEDDLMDHRTISFYGSLTNPQLPKVETVEVVTMDNPYLNKNKDRAKKPSDLVWLELHKGVLTAHAQIPADVSPSILTMADRIKVITFSGQPLKRNKGVASSITFSTEGPVGLAAEIIL